MLTVALRLVSAPRAHCAIGVLPVRADHTHAVHDLDDDGDCVRIGGPIVIAARYDEFTDRSKAEIHRSATTLFGWTIGTVTTTLPVAVAFRVADRGEPAATVALEVAAFETTAWL